MTLQLVFSVVVFGDPAPQGSKRHVGGGRMVESSKKVAPWRTDVVAAAVSARGDMPALDELVHVDMVFTFIRPRSHFRTGRYNYLLRDAAPAQPVSAPDLSKLARSTEDALQTAAVLRDDARIAEYGRLAKVWAGSGDPDALDSPGAVIRIYRIGDPT